MKTSVVGRPSTSLRTGPQSAAKTKNLTPFCPPLLKQGEGERGKAYQLQDNVAKAM